MGRPRKEEVAETPDSPEVPQVADKVIEVEAKPEGLRKWRCVNLNNFLKVDNQGNVVRIKPNAKPNVDQTEVIEAYACLIDKKKNAYLFIDGELGNRQEGENVIGTYRPLADWEITEIK